jgi:hypothetical protein
MLGGESIGYAKGVASREPCYVHLGGRLQDGAGVQRQHRVKQTGVWTLASGYLPELESPTLIER